MSGICWRGGPQPPPTGAQIWIGAYRQDVAAIAELFKLAVIVLELRDVLMVAFQLRS